MSQLLTSYIHDAERIAAIEDRFEPDIQQGIDPNRVHDLDTTYPADLVSLSFWCYVPDYVLVV